MKVTEGRYLVDCVSSLDEAFQELSVFDKDLSLANKIEGTLITCGIIEGSLNFSKKNNYSISKKPDESLKAITMKSIIKNFNNYAKKLNESKSSNYEELLERLRNNSSYVLRNDELSRYVPPGKIEKTENLFLYIRDSLFNISGLKDDIYINWFVEEIPVAGNLRMSEDLDRFLEFHHNDLFRKKNSKAVRSRLLSKEYDYLVFHIGEVKKQFDLRYFLNE